MFGSANRDEQCFEFPDEFNLQNDTSKSIAFGAGPHFCAGAWASRAMIADVALPGLFRRLKNLSILTGWFDCHSLLTIENVNSPLLIYI